jgi:SnoaL-like polyketide cyclase
MNTHSTVFDNASAEATTPDRIMQVALAAWKEGNFVKVVDQFNGQFTFTDHGLGVQFKDKGRLIEFLAKIRERFPDSKRRDNIIFSSGDRVISEWTLTATKTEPFPGERKMPICVRGVSVALIKNKKISHWSDYYDKLKSRRHGLAIADSNSQAAFDQEKALYRIVSRQLTSCSVIRGGKTICFDFMGQVGESVSIEMPFDQAVSIVMTIPRLLSAALKTHTGDTQTRYVFSVANWFLESAKDQNYRILTVRTPDGFEVAFAISFETSVAMGSALTCGGEAAAEKC